MRFTTTPNRWLATASRASPAHVRVSNSGRECGKVVAVALVGTGVTCVTLLPKRAPRERNGERQELPYLHLGVVREVKGIVARLCEVMRVARKG